MAILRNDTTVRSADGQTTSAIITAANIGNFGVATTSTYYIGTTQNVFNRASGAQTLTGVSIDGNAANITAYTINQNLGTSNSPSFVRLTSTQSTGTSPFVVSSTTVVNNLNSDLLDGQHGSYYQDPGNLALQTSWTIPIQTANSVAGFLYGVFGDALAFRTISNLQYWDGSAWQTYTNSAIQSILTGNIQTFATVAPANRKFRFEFTAAEAYIGGGVLVVHQQWNIGAHQISSMLEYYNGTSWVTAITERSSASGENNYHFYNRGDIHGNWTQYRITITSVDTVNSTTYTGIQLLYDYTRSNLPNNFLPITWDYLKNVTATGSLRTPIFYDSNNTSYYLDPANSATSLLVAGNVGIGTTSTSYKLDVVGSVRATTDNNFSFIQQRSATNTWCGLGYLTGASSKWFVGLRETGDDNLRWYNYTNSSERMVLTESGNVGIGTTSPYGKIDLGSNTGVKLFIYGNGGNVGYITGLGTDISGSSALSFFTGTGRFEWVKGSGNYPYSSYTLQAILDASSNFIVTSSVRTPIFYDSDNTSYYIDAASTSNLNSLVVASSARVGGASSRSVSGLTVGFTDNTAFAANTDVGDSDRMLSIVNESSTTNAMSVLGFRVNPNGGNANAMLDVKFVQTGATNTSALHYTFNHGGTFADRFSILSSGNVGIGATAPAALLQLSTGTPTASTSGIQFGDDTSARIFRSSSAVIRVTGAFEAGNGYIYASNYLQTGNNLIYPNGFSATQRLAIGNSANNAWIDGLTIAPGGIVTAYGDFRAPIFYDTDNTSYYINAAGTSVLNVISIASNSTFSTDSHLTFGPNSSWGSSIRFGGNGYTATGTEMASVVTTDGNLHLDAAKSNNGIYMNWYGGTGGVYFGNGSSGQVANISNTGNASFSGTIDATQFRDASNTAYYIDPASTSVLNALTVGGNNVLTTASTLTAGNLSGTIPSGVLGNSTLYVGTTAIALNRGSASQTLTGTSIDGNAATASNATQFGGEANTNFMRGLAGGTEANINNYTDNGFRTVSYTGHTKGLLSFSVGGSIGAVQHEYFYNIPSNGWRVRNKTDSTTWSSWGNVVMTDTNQGALTGTVITTGNSSGLSPTFTNLYAAVFYDSANSAYYIDPASTSNLVGLTVANTITGSISGNAATATNATQLGGVAAANYVRNDVDGSNSTALFRLTTITKSLTINTTWQDTGIIGSDLSTGCYMISVYVDNYAVNGGHYQETYTGMMSWFSTATNSTDYDEIVLHKSGHASNGAYINLRTIRQLSGSTNLKLQIISSVSTNGASNYVFKFRRLI